MSQLVHTWLRLNLGLEYSGEEVVESSPRLSLIKDISSSFGNDYNNQVYVLEQATNVSGLTLNLRSLVDVFGKPFSFSIIKWFGVFNLSAVVGQNILVGGPFATFTKWHQGSLVADIITPGGCLFRTSGISNLFGTEVDENGIVIYSSTGTPSFQLFIGGLS